MFARFLLGFSTLVELLVLQIQLIFGAGEHGMCALGERVSWAIGWCWDLTHET